MGIPGRHARDFYCADAPRMPNVTDGDKAHPGPSPATELASEVPALVHRKTVLICTPNLVSVCWFMADSLFIASGGDAYLG